MERTVALTTGLLLLLLVSMSAQDAVPLEILNRTRLIKVGNEAGTAFGIDYHGKLYLVTAKHIVASLPSGSSQIKVWQSGNWVDYSIVKTHLPPSDQVDIAVLETNEKVSQPFQVIPETNAGGVTFGQQVWFLGFPWGLHTSDRKVEFPFIKKGTMSAIDATDINAVVLYIDGFNNPGFSGGPIVYWSFSEHAYRICGVVKGYREDTAKILVNGERVDTNLLVNSGILVGYSISHALQAIEHYP